MEPKTLPLSGIKVVELATVVAAPTCARMLCAYGAEVIKVAGRRDAFGGAFMNLCLTKMI